MDRLSRNWGRPGLVSAVAVVDIALWDLKAKLLGQTLLTLLGKFRDSIPAYGSGGFKSVRRVLGDETEIYVDANGANSRKQALKTSQSFNEFGLRGLKNR
jgi:L-alanine-DL-glutamate epimerase-like enolase superfamily enzyme